MITQGGGGFAPVIPVVVHQGHTIEFDISFAPAGLLRPYGMDEDLVPDRDPGFGQVKYESPVWRGFYPISESMLQKLRRPGTREALWSAEEISARAAQFLSLRADRTAEWAACQFLSNGTMTLTYADGKTSTVDWQFPSDLLIQKTGTARWSDYANADIIEDIQTTRELANDHGWEVGQIIMGRNVERYILQNSAMQTLIRYHRNLPENGLVSVGEIPQGMLLGLPHRVYRAAYQADDYFSAAYTTGTTVTMTDGDGGQLKDLANGDRITFGPSTHASNKGAKESQTVTGAPSGTDVTVSAALNYDYAAGDRIQWHRTFLHPDDLLLLPQDDGEQWAQFWAAESIYGNLGAGGPKYAVSKMALDDIPLKGHVKGGIDGLPVQFRNGRHARIRTHGDS